MLVKNKRFEVLEEPVIGLKKISRAPLKDERGRLERLYCSNEFQEFFPRPIAQVNFTETKIAGTVRGLHYQLAPADETKLVSVIDGELYDIVLDLRTNMPSYGKVFCFHLTSDLHHSLLIPAGFAHGFQTLKDDVKLVYFHDNFYDQEKERGVNILDEALNINFPKSIQKLSKRDALFPNFQEEERNAK